MIKHDKHYKHILSLYRFMNKETQQEVDKFKDYSFEEWAEFVAKEILIYPHEDIWMVEELKCEIDSLSDGEYCLALDYWGGFDSKVLIQHNSFECSFHKFWTSPYYFVNYGKRCPVCSKKNRESKGEETIRKLLESLNINFKSQFCFDDLKGKNNAPMPFDFAVFDKENKVYLIIEFDGIYHYKNPKANSKQTAEKQQTRDKIKDEYCNKHNIEILRIPFWEYKDIEKIILEKLSKENVSERKE